MLVLYDRYKQVFHKRLATIIIDVLCILHASSVAKTREIPVLIFANLSPFNRNIHN